MKNLLKIVGILVVFLIVLAIVVPLFFQDDIAEIVKVTTNDNLEATVDFEDINLSLFSSFPYLSVSINNISVINKAPFEGDTIFTAKSFEASLDLISLISGDELKIKSIFLNEPNILVYILEDGTANYNITKNTLVKTDTVEKPNAEFNIDLQSYTIKNGQIAFIDQTSNILVAMRKFNHSGKGDFSQETFVLDTETSIDEFTIEFEGVKYLNKVKTVLDMELGINLSESKFELKDNSLILNNLTLNFDGSIAIPNENILIDLKFNSPKTDFKDIISLIPAIYSNNFSNIKTSGKMELTGNVKGELSENKIPTFNLSLKVMEGNLKYPDLPTPINNVDLTFIVSNTDGIIDHTIIDLSKLHLELGEDPIDAKLYITNPVSGPNIETEIRGLINLANVKSAFDLKDITKLEGIIKSDFKAKGNISTIGNNYENINAKGNISISNFVFLSDNFNQEISINNAALEFTPRNVKLKNFNAKIGESDIKANGSLNNLISYILSDGILIGNLNLSSNYFDFNPYLTDDSDAETTVNNTSNTAFDIPSDIDFKLSSNFKKVLYDNLELTNVTGQININNSKVSLDNLSMNLLRGTLTGSGYYSKTELQENPEIDFKLNIKDFNVKQTYDKFASVKQFAPIAKYIQGNFSSKLKLTTTLDSKMMPIWESFFSNGLLNLKSAEIKNFKPFTTVGSLLNLNELSNPKVQNLNPKFEIINGRFYISPVKYKIGKYDVVLSGSNGMDQSLDYVMEIDVPAGNIKNKTNKAISGLLGKDVNLVNASIIKVKVLIEGTVDNPKVKTSAGDVVKDVVISVVEEVKDQIVNEAKEKADEIKAKAEKKLKEEAKKKEEELKKELEKEAKKKLKKIFGFG